MVAEVFAGIGAFKAMFDIAKSLKDMDDAVKRNAAVANLWEQILTAQTRYAAALEEIHELKEKLARIETWERQKERYELKRYEPGLFLYALKESMATGEPSHHICPKCYEHGKHAILQGMGVDQGIETLHCHECDATFHVGRFVPYDRPAPRGEW